MAGEWLAIQKNEVNPALKKAGVESRTMLETVLGNPYGTFNNCRINVSVSDANGCPGTNSSMAFTLNL